jgi:hypothetical protein
MNNSLHESVGLQLINSDDLLLQPENGYAVWGISPEQ